MNHAPRETPAPHLPSTKGDGEGEEAPSRGGRASLTTRQSNREARKLVEANAASGPPPAHLPEPRGWGSCWIGDFGGLDAQDEVLDLALDHDSTIYGTTRNGFVRIDALDAKVVYVKRDGLLKYPSSLSFAPTGTVDPTKEALVGYQKSEYVRIDLVTGVITKVGDLNDPVAVVKYESAGDVYSMERNGRAFVAIKTIEPDAGTGTDQFAEIDPTTGRIKQVVGDIGQAETLGLAQWAGTAYGFNAKGNIVEIAPATGKGKTIMTLMIGGTAGAWSGAGVTTDAPTKL